MTNLDKIKNEILSRSTDDWASRYVIYDPSCGYYFLSHCTGYRDGITSKEQATKLAILWLNSEKSKYDGGF